jgi:TrmH family RNA methyltransferase
MSETILSKDNAKVKEAFKAKDGKGDRFLVEGFHLVEMAVKNHSAEMIFALKEYPSDVPTYLVNDSIIEKLASTKTPEGIVALCHKKANAPLSGERLLYLDEINDPGNMGTLLRTALAFGWKDVVVSKCSAEPYMSKVLLSSQGAIFALNLLESSRDPSADLSSLKNQGYTLIASDLQSAVPPEEIKQEGKLCLILGNEARGVRKDLIQLAEKSVRIPMGGIDSLNVGVAGGILMYELHKK